MLRRMGDRGHRRTFGSIPAAGVLVAALVATGCHIPIQRHDWSSYAGEGAAYFQREEYLLPFRPDPLEPMNRLSFGLTTVFLVGVADPVASGWRALAPQPVRTSLVNAANNASYPQAAVNHLLQGNAEAAGGESARFGINTTAGVLGLFDPAATKSGIPARPTSLGDTFRGWGWRESTYLVFPMRGPTTLRDALGDAGDTFLNPLTWFFPLGVALENAVINAERTGFAKRYLLAQEDPYEPARRLLLARREIVDLPAAEAEAADTAATRALRYAGFTPRDPRFAERGVERRTYITQTRRKLPYSVWLQDDPAPLVFLLPGYGGHRLSSGHLALAEVLFDDGYSVVTLSSASNYEFMRHAATTPYPGDAPQDAADIHAALRAVWRDLRSRYGDCATQKLLVGASLGGHHALHIAAAPPSKRVGFDGFLAIQPPVQLDFAAGVLDDYYNALLAFPADERDSRATLAIQKAARIGVSADAAVAPRFSDPEARFLIGLSYRLSLHDTIWTARAEREPGFLKTSWTPLQKASASQEILEYSLMEFAYGFLLPYLRDERRIVPDARELFRRSDLREIGGLFLHHSNVAIIINEDDFLLADGDVRWVQTTFPEDRRAVFERGGHLGNLWEEEVQIAIKQMLRRLRQTLPESAEFHANARRKP